MSRSRTGAVLAGMTATACIAAAGVGAGSADAATTSWAATDTAAVPTSSGIDALGALAGSTPMTVQVALALRNAATAQQDVADGTTMSEAQFASQFSPSADTVAQVQAWLRSEGLTPTAVSGDRLLISATGSASAIEQAFDTTLDRVSTSSTTGFANLTAAKVPASLSGTVVSVLGLNNVFAAQTPKLTATTLSSAGTATAQPSRSCTLTGVAYLCTYDPQGLQAAYDATSAPTGASTTEAIFAEGDLTQVVTDLRQEESDNGLPQVPVTIDQTGAASTDTSGADEWDMDTQYSTGMAQNVKSLILYDAASLDDADLTASFAAFASQDTAQAGSASFGGCEFESELDGSMAADDEIFEEAALQGQTVFASAGDTGGFCSDLPINGVPAGIPDVEYPASSPYVVSVGGTSLLTNSDGSYDSELAWTAGGGGPSLFEAQPSWQASDGVVGSVAGLVGKRTVPDVAMDADPNSGADVDVDGTYEGVGGTSLASPLALGVWDRVESADGNAAAFAAPKLYAAAGTSVFHDVTLGDTGPWPATPGYDLATGIGSFDGAQAVSQIK